MVGEEKGSGAPFRVICDEYMNDKEVKDPQKKWGIPMKVEIDYGSTAK